MIEWTIIINSLTALPLCDLSQTEILCARSLVRSPTRLCSGGFALPLDDSRPLETPRGFAQPARAVATLHAVAAAVERDYGSLSVPWGEVLRFRVGGADLPGNGAPGFLGAIRTIAPGAFEFEAGSGGGGGYGRKTAPARHGDTWFACIEFSTLCHKIVYT